MTPRRGTADPSSDPSRLSQKATTHIQISRCLYVHSKPYPEPPRPASNHGVFHRKHHFGAVYRELFLPPVNRAMRVLDRSFFQKRIRLTAANIFNIKNQTRVKRECLQDVLDAPRIKPFVKTPWRQDGERTLLLLKPSIKVDGMACKLLALEFTADGFLHRPIHA